MASRSYLVCARSKKTYPSFQEKRFSPKRQTIASGEWCVPLLWLGCFRKDDLTVSSFELHDRVVEARAPVVHRRRVRKRLLESAKQLQRQFDHSDAWASHAHLLLKGIDGISDDFPYLTIEWEEIAEAGVKSKFFRDVNWVMDYFGGARKRSVALKLSELSFSQIDLKSDFPDPAIVSAEDFSEQDWKSLAHLMGSQWERKIPWEPKKPRAGARKKKKEEPYYGDTPGATQRGDNHRGVAAYDEGNMANAERYFNKAIRAAGAFALPFFNRGNVRWVQGEYEKAIEDYDAAALRKRRFDIAYYSAGMLRLQIGRSEEALESLDRALKCSPNNTTYLAGRAACWMGLGWEQKADKEFSRLRKRYPSHADIPELWAAALTRKTEASKSDRMRSIKLAQAACQLDKEQDYEKSIALAEAYAAAGKLDDAILAMFEAMGRTNGDLRNRLSKQRRAYQRQKRKAEA